MRLGGLSTGPVAKDRLLPRARVQRDNIAHLCARSFAQLPVHFEPVGDEIREAAEQNRLKFGQLFALLEDQSKLTLCYVKSLDQPSSDVRKIYPTALLLRVWTASQAIRSLLRDGFNDDAFAGVRTMLEIEFQLSAISKEPELTEQLVRENEHYRGRRLQNLLKHKIKLPG